MGKKKGGTNKKKQERQRQLDEERAREESRRAIVQHANFEVISDASGETSVVPRNSLAGFPPAVLLFKVRDNEDAPLKLHFSAASTLTPTILKQCFELLKLNMEERYLNAGWTWTDKRKLRELKEDEARYLYLTDPKNDDRVAGFVHYRFLHEGEEEVLYVYELQIDPRYARRGIGKRLMVLLELIGRKFKMSWIMLTVFVNNTPAIRFYESLRYSEDETSPEVSQAGENSSSYIILSKPLSNMKVLRPKPASEVSTNAVASQNESSTAKPQESEPTSKTVLSDSKENVGGLVESVSNLSLD